MVFVLCESHAFYVLHIQRQFLSRSITVSELHCSINRSCRCNLH